MTKAEIIEDLARNRVVEETVKNIAHSHQLTSELQDLAQSVYVILLEYDEAKLVDLYESKALGFFLTRIISNQYNSNTSPFYKQIRKFRLSTCPLSYNKVNNSADLIKTVPRHLFHHSLGHVHDPYNFYNEAIDKDDDEM